MNARGFSLSEVMVALLLFAAGVAALMELQSALTIGARRQVEFQKLWRYAAMQVEPMPQPLPEGWRVIRQETPRLDCISINATIISPGGRQATLLQLHCASDARAGAANVMDLPF